MNNRGEYYAFLFFFSLTGVLFRSLQQRKSLILVGQERWKTVVRGPWGPRRLPLEASYMTLVLALGPHLYDLQMCSTAEQVQVNRKRPLPV